MHLASLPSHARARMPDAHAAHAALAAPSATVLDREREREWIRASGLLALAVPREYGGDGATWQTVFDTVRTIARVDLALARLLGFHHLQVATIRLHAHPRQRSRLLADGVAQDRFWGDALDPLDRRLVATPVAGGYLLNGEKRYAGAGGADWLTVSAWDPLARAPLVAVLPAAQAGVSVADALHDPHENDGAGAGSVRFENVLLPEENVLQAAGHPSAPQSSLRPQVARLMLANLSLGLAEAAIGAAHTDPAAAACSDHAAPLLRAARALADAAACQLDAACARAADLDTDERCALAASVTSAVALAEQAIDALGANDDATGGPPPQRRADLDAGAYALLGSTLPAPSRPASALRV